MLFCRRSPVAPSKATIFHCEPPSSRRAAPQAVPVPTAARVPAGDHQEHRGGDARLGQTWSRWAALQPGDTEPSFRTSGGGIRWRTLPSDGSVLHHPVRGPGGGSRRITFRPRCAPCAAAPRAGMRYARTVWPDLVYIHGGSGGAPLVVSAGVGIRAPRTVREPLMNGGVNRTSAPQAGLRIPAL